MRRFLYFGGLYLCQVLIVIPVLFVTPDNWNYIIVIMLGLGVFAIGYMTLFLKLFGTTNSPKWWGKKL